MKIIQKKQVLDIFSKREKKIINKEPAEKRKILIDYREKNSLVIANLKNIGFEIELKELKVGDYILKNTVIERKTVSDFISSIINGRLLKQIEELKQFEKKLLIVEGISEKEIYNDEGIGMNGNAIRGFLLSVLLKHKIPILFTKNSEDTAKFIDVLSRKKVKEVKLNSHKKILSKKDQMQFIIEGFQGIGPKKAKELLKKFKTIQNIINASKEDLEKVVGKKASTIIDLINSEY